tara:strand:- start:2480 stop:2830 length:351 start_codon:yes stop_codon:yes gene_type:complete
MNPEVAQLLQALSEDDKRAIMKLARQAKRKEQEGIRMQRKADNQKFRQDLKHYERLASTDPAEMTDADREFISEFEGRMDVSQGEPMSKREKVGSGIGIAGVAALFHHLNKKAKGE